MLKFILGNLSYFLIMAFMVICCINVEGRLGGKFLVLGLMSLVMGLPAGRRTRFGLLDQRYKEQPIIWWQVLVGVVLFAIGGFIVSNN